MTSAYAYDAASEVTSITHNGPAGTLMSFAYTYDGAGNRTSVTKDGGTPETYALDALRTFTMRVYRIHRPVLEDRYAVAIARDAPDLRRCHEPDGAIWTGKSRQPLILEWDPGDRWHRNSTRLGDFTDGGGRVAVKAQVAAELHSRFAGWEPGPVHLLPGPRELAFDDEALREIWVTTLVSADMTRSSYTVFQECAVCGARLFDLTGVQIEKYDVVFDSPLGMSDKSETRKPGMGLIVRQCDLAGAAVFRTHEFGGLMVTQDFVDYVRERGFTNIDFREVGETY